MHKRTFQLIAASTLTLAAIATQADVMVNTGHMASNISPRNSAVADCVDTVRKYHTREARLFLSNKGSVRAMEDGFAVSVRGWVWRDGERTRVMHECVIRRDSDKIALNINYDSETQLAGK